MQASEVNRLQIDSRIELTSSSSFLLEGSASSRTPNRGARHIYSTRLPEIPTSRFRACGLLVSRRLACVRSLHPFSSDVNAQ